MGRATRPSVYCSEESSKFRPVLALYSSDHDTIVSVLIQKQPSGAVARALTPTEQKYGHIDKEVLTITWSCEQFSDPYLLGKTFHVHKPFISLLSYKYFDNLPYP